MSDIECSYVGLLITGPLFMLVLFLLVAGCFSSWVKMLCDGSVLKYVYSWAKRYCSAEICVGFICCLFHVTSLPVFVKQMWYDLP